MRLNQVTLATTNLDRAVDFYQTLGLELIVFSPPRYARFLLPEGGATLSVELAPELALGHAGRPGAVIYFECDDLDDRCAALREEGIRFDSDPRDERWLWREARLRDPGGHVLCLYRAGGNRTDPPWRLRRKAEGSEGWVGPDWSRGRVARGGEQAVL